MYYICTQSGLIITSRKTKEEADNFIIGKPLFVRPSSETLELEKARQAFREMEALTA